MINYALVLIGLIYSAYTDYTKRIIPNYLTFSLIIIGIIYNLVYSIYISNIRFFITYIIVFAIVYAIFYMFWKIGIFAGGDAKLFLAIYSLIPIHNFHLYGISSYSYTFVFSMLGLSVLTLFPYTAFIGFIEILKRPDIKSYIYKEFIIKSIDTIESSAQVIATYLVLSYFNLPLILILPISIISGFVPKFIRIPYIIIFFPIALYLDFYTNIKVFLILILISYLLFSVIKLFVITRSGIMNYSKKVRDLKEGDLLAYQFYRVGDNVIEPLKEEGLFKQLYSYIRNKDLDSLRSFIAKRKALQNSIVIDNTLAMGLTLKDIEMLNNQYGLDKEVILKKTSPIAVAVLIAFILMILFGDILFYIVRYLM